MNEIEEGLVNKETHEDGEVPVSFSETTGAQMIAKEDSVSLAKEIKELKDQIADTIERQNRIAHMQKTYGDIPDEALIESDASIKKTSVEELKSRLATLEEKKKANAPTGLKGFVKKINTFLSF
jgi:polyhydroxyalkanoate synthesis regulator phasin